MRIEAVRKFKIHPPRQEQALLKKNAYLDLCFGGGVQLLCPWHLAMETPL